MDDPTFKEMAMMALKFSLAWAIGSVVMLSILGGAVWLAIKLLR